jgi:glycosyltransferase involved in cell wall biosynthesis
MIAISENEIINNWKYKHVIPCVSVLCITYNHERYIAQAIESFLMQKTDFPFEIVIGEDCSTDSTLSILRAYKKRYPNIIQLIANKKNMGGILNFVNTYKECRGDYFAMCEGDDYWIDSMKLQTQYYLMQAFSHINLSFHHYKVEENTIIKEVEKKFKDKQILSTKEMIDGGGEMCCSASLMLKKEVILNLPSWFQSVSFGDYFMQILGSYPNGGLYMDSIMSVYRSNVSGGWSSRQANEVNLDKSLAYVNNVEMSLLKLDFLLENKFHKELQFKIDTCYLKDDCIKNLSFYDKIKFYIKCRKKIFIIRIWRYKIKNFISLFLSVF